MKFINLFLANDCTTKNELFDLLRSENIYFLSSGTKIKLSNYLTSKLQLTAMEYVEQQINLVIHTFTMDINRKSIYCHQRIVR